MIKNISFKATILDEKLRERICMEQRPGFFPTASKKAPLITELVKKLNEETDKNGDIAYLTTNDRNFPEYYKIGNVEFSSGPASIKYVKLEIVKKDGTYEFYGLGTVNEENKTIEFQKEGSKFNVTI